MTSCLSAVAQIGRQGLEYQSGVYGCSVTCFPPLAPYFPAGPLAPLSLHPMSAGGVNAAAGIDCEHDLKTWGGPVNGPTLISIVLYQQELSGRSSVQCAMACQPYGGLVHRPCESESTSQLIFGFHRNRYQQSMSWWDPKESTKRRSCEGGAGEISGYTTTKSNAA